MTMIRSVLGGLMVAGAIGAVAPQPADAASIGSASRAAWTADSAGLIAALPLIEVQNQFRGPAGAPRAGAPGGGPKAGGNPGGGRNISGGGGPGRIHGGGGGGRRYGGGGGYRHGGGFDPGAAAAVGIVGAVIGLAAEQAAQEQARRDYQRQRRYYRQQRYYYED